MTEQPQIPEWIYPGAEVVVYVDNYDQRDRPTLYAAVVGKIAKNSFLVTFTRTNGTSGEERIKLDGLVSKNQGTGWRSWYYRVLEPTSERVAKLQATATRSGTRDDARRAMTKLIERHDDALMDNLDLLRGAIVALSAHADVVLSQTESEATR